MTRDELNKGKDGKCAGMPTKKGVCYGCEKRHVNCHDECDDYQKERGKRMQVLDNRRDHNQKEDYFQRRTERALRKQRRNKH